MTNPLHVLANDPTGSALGLNLPAGTLVSQTDDGPWHEPLLWCSDTPVDAAAWNRLLPAARTAGLHPVLLEPREDGGEPFWRGGLAPDATADPGAHDVEEILADLWTTFTVEHGPFGDEDEKADFRDSLAPFGEEWPGLAPALPAETDPDRRAAEIAASLVDGGWLTRPHLGLVPAGRSADIPAAIGWVVNYLNDIDTLCGVLRSWEDRFGTRVVALSADRLDLSVAAPVRTTEQALSVAVEHLAVCSDNLWQGSDTVQQYVEDGVLGKHHWTFWWD